jgi:hypothetical protein
MSDKETEFHDLMDESQVTSPKGERVRKSEVARAKRKSTKEAVDTRTKH